MKSDQSNTVHLTRWGRDQLNALNSQTIGTPYNAALFGLLSSSISELGIDNRQLDLCSFRSFLEPLQSEVSLLRSIPALS